MEDLNHCPYGENPCPKITEVKEALDKVNTALAVITRLVFVMAGIMVLDVGVLII